MKNTKIYFTIKFLLFLLPLIMAVGVILIFFKYNKDLMFFISFFLLAVGLTFFIIGLFPFIQMIYRCKKVEEKIAEDISKKGLLLNGGAVGTGKSANGGDTVLNHSQSMWEFVCYQVKLYSLMLPKWTAEGNDIKIAEFKELKSCFDFYNEHQDILPCLFSYPAIEFDGKKSLPLTIDHLTQKNRLPPFTDFFIDECSHLVDTDLYKDRAKTNIPDLVDAFFRFPRHFLGDGVLGVCCEQDPNKSYIGIRRPTSYNKFMLGQLWVSTPNFLMRLLEKHKIKFMKNNKATAKDSCKLIKLERLVKSIGFRQLHFFINGNTENNQGFPKIEQVEYIPATLNFHYDERAFRNYYLCKDKDIIYEPYKSLLLDENTKGKVLRATKS